MSLTPEAQTRLNDYLCEMRTSLADAPVDIGEIERDIRDHIDSELAGKTSPVSFDELNAVLLRLGDPSQWADVTSRPPTSAHEEKPIEKWLPFANLIATAAFVLMPPLLLLSWCVARLSLGKIVERGEAIGPRRWLLYPPILIVVVPLTVFGLLWAFAPFAELGASVFSQPRFMDAPVGPLIGMVSVALAGLGLYWLLLGVVAAGVAPAVRFVLYPFAERFSRRHGFWLSGAGATLAAASIVAFALVTH